MQREIQNVFHQDAVFPVINVFSGVEDVKDWIDKSVESKTENDDIAKEINRFQRKRGRPPKPKPRE